MTKLNKLNVFGALVGVVFAGIAWLIGLEVFAPLCLVAAALNLWVIPSRQLDGGA